MIKKYIDKVIKAAKEDNNTQNKDINITDFSFEIKQGRRKLNIFLNAERKKVNLNTVYCENTLQK